jgi:beta-glucosidase/6-phospho-beta-glucosidase/beta-galactosidase
VIPSDKSDPFLWGVATSAYQSEGGYNAPGQPRTNWASAESRGDVAVCGEAAGFWHRYEEDFARAAALGLNAFRLGLEWTRLWPTRATELDPAALDHYAAILRACQRAGLEPIVTLHHFVHPAWLGPDPWLADGTAELFARYARELCAALTPRLDRPLRWLITINEPNMLALNTYLGRQFPGEARPGLVQVTRALSYLLRAHILSYRALHSLYRENGWPTPRITFNNYCSDLYWSDKLLLDLGVARRRGVARRNLPEYIREKARAFDRTFTAARLPLHRDAAYYLGSAVKRLANWLGYRRFDDPDFAPALDTLYSGDDPATADLIALDYYDPFAAHAFRLPVLWDHEFRNRSFRAWVLATITSKWWDWRVLPAGLRFFCTHYAEDFGQPILIAENGMAIRRRRDNQEVTPRRDKITRSEFLRLHVAEVQAMRAAGVPVLGYLHWSLCDNYEWGSYTPRFGLYSIDYRKGLEREAVDPWGDTPSRTYAALIDRPR